MELPETIPPPIPSFWSRINLQARQVQFSIAVKRHWILLSMSALTALLSFTFLLLLPIDGVKSRELKLLELALPGSSFTPCRRVTMYTEGFYNFIDDLAYSVKKHNLPMATAKHFGFSDCVIVVCSTTGSSLPPSEDCYPMINPHLVKGENPVFISTEDPQLCQSAKAVQSKRQSTIQIMWDKGDGVAGFVGKFDKPASYKMQHMLDVLHGQDVCG